MLYNDEQDDDGDADAPAAAAAAAHSAPAARRFEPSTSADTVDPKKSKRARHPDEVKADPDRNHIDVEHYVEAICTVLKQMMPLETRAMDELRRYAAAAKARNSRARAVSAGTGLFALMRGAVVSDAGMPRLSHKAPTSAAAGAGAVHILTGEALGGPKPAKRANSRKPPPSRFVDVPLFGKK
jgi:hypothetical protein